MSEPVRIYPNEVWMVGGVLLMKMRDGTYQEFVAPDTVSINNQMLIDNPVIGNECLNAKLKVLQKKKETL